MYCIDNVERMIKYNKFSTVERENKKDIENGEREREIVGEWVNPRPQETVGAKTVSLSSFSIRIRFQGILTEREGSVQ